MIVGHVIHLLLNLNRITPLYPPAPEHTGIYANVSLIGLSYCTKNSRVRGQVALCQGCHHTAGTGPVNTQAHFIADRKRMADPAVFNKTLLAGA